MTRAVGRLAPTPSGHLHLGNVCAFTAAWLSVRNQGGRLLFRLEDVDRGRARPDIAEAQRQDLRWLGIDWDEDVPAQSLRDYRPWLARLPTYRCMCTRRLLRERPCPCRDQEHSEGAVRFRVQPGSMSFEDRRWGTRTCDPTALADPILQRRDGLFAYTLAVVADDITDGVTEVVRGADLLDFTATQIQLWQILTGGAPTWLHTPLILGPDAKKLSKSHGSQEVRALREAGWTPEDIFRVVLPWLGLEPAPLHSAAARFVPDAGPLGPLVSDHAT